MPASRNTSTSFYLDTSSSKDKLKNTLFKILRSKSMKLLLPLINTLTPKLPLKTKLNPSMPELPTKTWILKLNKLLKLLNLFLKEDLNNTITPLLLFLKLNMLLKETLSSNKLLLFRIAV